MLLKTQSGSCWLMSRKKYDELFIQIFNVTALSDYRKYFKMNSTHFPIKINAISIGIILVDNVE